MGNALFFSPCLTAGNPPFVGKKEQTKEQKTELVSLFDKKVKGVGNLDYVSGWYIQAANYIENTNIFCAFVSTNSITQGEQVPTLWKCLVEKGININFAHKTFKWNSEAVEKAAVHCVIIGFSYINKTNKMIFSSDRYTNAKDINPYLIDGPTVLIENRGKGICDAPPIMYGSMPIDDGHLILSSEDVDLLLTENKDNNKFIRKYLGGAEMLRNTDRWCLWLKDIATPITTTSIRLYVQFQNASGAAIDYFYQTINVASNNFSIGYNGYIACHYYKDTEVNFLNAIYTLLVVDRVFRQSERTQ